MAFQLESGLFGKLLEFPFNAPAMLFKFSVPRAITGQKVRSMVSQPCVNYQQDFTVRAGRPGDALFFPEKWVCKERGVSGQLAERIGNAVFNVRN